MIHPLQGDRLARRRHEELARRAQLGKRPGATEVSRSVRRAVRVVVVALVLAVSLAILSAATAFASGGRAPRSADVIFTKWITSLPADPSFAGAHMAGVVGGDVGRGRYMGLVLGDDTTSQPGFWLGHALYGVFGREHSFVADLHITENDLVVPVTATIRGVVAWGWMRGARVTGEYRLVDSCLIPTPGNIFAPSCIPGTLHLQLG